MNPHSYFISDLHLQPECPRITQDFILFMRNSAPLAENVFILGDFFEVWVGDDDTSAFNEQIKAELYSLGQKGVNVYFMPGNRDFLLGSRFAKSANMTILSDPFCIRLYNQQLILCHGDFLCTDDSAHQRFRRVSSNRTLQQFFLALPLSWRLKIAKKIRKKSQRRNARLDEQIMDVNANAVKNMIKKNQADLLIHGHTHKPKIEPPHVVLGAWHHEASIYRLDQSGIEKLNKGIS